MTDSPAQTATAEAFIEELLGTLSLEQKIGQMQQVDVSDPGVWDEVKEQVRAGRVGSVINLFDIDKARELQRIAAEESPHGIPLLIGRDVIHGFKTVMPIPLGQAATWNPDVVSDGARIAAREAATEGINWTFAPMLDISRDARWGRIAESLGEDPFLASVLGVAMVNGFQGDDLSEPGRIAACGKHFAGYGASESGRDYATTNIPENELRNVYLPPFRAVVNAGVASLMTSFGDLDGVPCSGNEFLLRQVLRQEWSFDGFVVSDWDSVRQLTVHGFTSNDREAAFEGANAGVDMEMVGTSYVEHLPGLITDGLIRESQVDDAVRNLLRAKHGMGLFDNAVPRTDGLPEVGDTEARDVAYQAALQSAVLLKNEHNTLPLNPQTLQSLAVIGPLADAPHEQMGTWVFDGDVTQVVSCLAGLQQRVGRDIELRFAKALDCSRSQTGAFDEAAELARQSDTAVLFLGEESILSGEAHSRADISLPGAQAELVRRVRAAGKPVIAVVLAGRPLTLANILDEVDALLFAWHPGAMGGPAIADLLFGAESPGGKLPVSFPRVVGQIPLYYNHKNCGRPATPDGIVHIDDIEIGAPQTSLGMTSFHLDVHYTPQFPFGFGLSYGDFHYANIQIDREEMPADGQITISAELSNRGSMAATEVAQLYVRDLAGNVTRPVRELKGFQRVRVEPGQTITVSFALRAADLAFFGRRQQELIEPGEFHAWIGGSSATELRTSFRIVARA